MSAPAVELRVDDAIATLRLNRPQVENAVDDRVMAELERHLDTIEAASDRTRAVILTGAGDKTFSAGGDLRYFAGLRSRDRGIAMSERMQAILRRLADGPRPVIAAINGNAWGGGCEILLACHLRIAAEGTRFGLRQAKMGVVPGWGGGARLFALVGHAHALRLLLTAATLGAEDAARLGFVDRVVPRMALMTEARALAARIVQNPPHTVAAMLDLARAIGEGRDVTARETALFGDCWQSDHFQAKLDEWS